MRTSLFHPTTLIFASLALNGLGCRAEHEGSTSRSPPPSPTPMHLAAGEELFDRYCVECHGAAARGSMLGPPLVHHTYRPEHHADAAFVLAVERGVRAHHWGFGDMPAIPSLRRDDVEKIVRYVRWLQEDAGVY